MKLRCGCSDFAGPLRLRQQLLELVLAGYDVACGQDVEGDVIVADASRRVHDQTGAGVRRCVAARAA